MKAAALVALLALTATPCFATDTPKADIEKVVQQFQASLKTRDAKTLGSLFIPNAAWVEALGSDTLRTKRASKPDLVGWHASTPGKFVDFVGSTTSSIEERFHDVRIETDGTVGIVYFTFEFLMDNTVQNRGAETWQLVHTDDGWKIAAMLYSSNF